MPALTSREHLGVRLLCSIQIELMHKAKNVAYTYSNSQAIATPSVCGMQHWEWSSDYMCTSSFATSLSNQACFLHGDE